MRLQVGQCQIRHGFARLGSATGHVRCQHHIGQCAQGLGHARLVLINVQRSTRNGFYWWEIDPTYYGLKLLSYTGFIWGLKPVPQSVLDEGARAEHAASIAAAQRAALVHPEYSSLKKVVPAAAAFAVATAASAQATMPKKAEDPAMHRDVTEETHNMAQKNPPPAVKPEA